MRTAVLLPTLNEAESVGDVIAGVRRAGKGFSIYVVDSGSSDGTPDIAKRCGANVIAVSGKGKASAIRKAFSVVGEECVVLLDSDSSYCPEEIPRLLEALEGCDAVVGSRFRGSIGPGSMPFINRFGNRALSAIASVLFLRGASDVCSGFWAFRKAAYRKMDIREGHFELEANFFTECVKKGLILREVPISYRSRKGKTKLNPLHGVQIGLFLIMERIR